MDANKNIKTNLIVYVLELQGGKWYIGQTENLEARIPQHFSGEGSKFTKRYPPIKVVETHENCDQFDEDKYVKVYMAKYGIENVRGGAYCTEFLNPDTIAHIEHELDSAMGKCYKCKTEGHFSNRCPTTNQRQIKAQTEKQNNILLSMMRGEPIENYTPDKEDRIDKEDRMEEDILVCERCGREGHKWKSCYAKSDVEGFEIWDGEEEIIPACYRCGREGHKSPSCYARTDINGDYL